MSVMSGKKNPSGTLFLLRTTTTTRFSSRWR